MIFSEYFKQNYYNKMLQPSHPNNPIRNRADSFYLIFKEIEKNKNNIIVETGCMRGDHGEFCFGDDGCSTFIFDEFINKNGGEFYSVDINPNNTAYAKSKTSEKTNIFTNDSVSFLWNFKSKIDFLYLDSYDIDKENPHPSQLHHLKELCAIIKNLKSNSIICVDDHDAFLTNGKIGKGTYVKDFMENIKAKKLYEGYQIIWQMQ
jgi:hypothetical protein